MKPALLNRLRTLARDGWLPSSKLSASMRRELQPLFDARILEDRKHGAGRRVWVARPDAFARWIAHRLPEGLYPNVDAPPRAEAVASFRDAKVARRTDGEPLLLRGWTKSARLTADGTPIDLTGLTSLAGAVTIVLGEAREVSLSGTIGVVENLEAFLYAERIPVQLDGAIYAGGRISARKLAWIADQAEAKWIHLGDFDPVGMSEYLRLREACAERATLWVPDDLDELVRMYGKPTLVAASTGVWQNVRRSAEPAVERVVEILDRHAMGLEQEVFLR